MSRLSRFEAHRYIGTRDTMVVYDCDQPDELDELKERVESEDLVGRLLIQSFAPDTMDEARNRCFHPVASARPIWVGGQEEPESDL